MIHCGHISKEEKEIFYADQDLAAKIKMRTDFYLVFERIKNQ